MTAIGNDAATEDSGELTLDEAADVFMKAWTPPNDEEGVDASKKKPSKEPEEEETAEPDPKTDEDAPAEEPEADDEGTEDGDAEETYFKIKFDGKEHEVPASKLTRLYGQEAALTKKSMEVAELRKSTEADVERQTAASNALLERVRARFEPYAKLDFNLLAHQLPIEEYQALRQSAQAAYQDVEFLEKHTDAYVQHTKQQQLTEKREQAKESIKILSGPADKGGIEGWNEKLYDDIRAYAVTQGADSAFVNTIIEPWAVKMMHQAMLYERGKVKAESKVTVTKVNKTPKKIVKTSHAPETNKSGRSTSAEAASKKAQERLAQTGKIDDAAAAFEAMWKASARDSDD